MNILTNWFWHVFIVHKAIYVFWKLLSKYIQVGSCFEGLLEIDTTVQPDFDFDARCWNYDHFYFEIMCMHAFFLSLLAYDMHALFSFSPCLSHIWAPTPSYACIRLKQGGRADCLICDRSDFKLAVSQTKKSTENLNGEPSPFSLTGRALKLS